MGPNTPEQNPPEKSMQQQAQETANRIITEIQTSYRDRLNDIKNENNEGERLKMRAQLAEEMKKDWRSRIQEQTVDTSKTGVTDRQDEIKKSNNAKRIFLEVGVMKDNNIKVLDPKSQIIVDEITAKIRSGEITDRGAIIIEQTIGKQLIEGVVIGKKGQQQSEFDQGLIALKQIDSQTANPLIKLLKDNPDTFGTTVEEIDRKFATPAPERSLTPEQQQQMAEEMGQRGDPRFGPDGGYYATRFTDTQKDLIATFYSPERFVDYMEHLSNGDDNGKNFLKKEEVIERKRDIEHKIKDYYEKNHRTFKEGELKDQVEKHWGEEVSEMMNWRVSDIINQLFLELQQKSPYKFYEEIMQEDIFQGPGMIQKRIQAAINSLMTKVDQIEGNEKDPLYQKMKDLQLYRHAAESYIDERDGKIYPRLHPLPFGQKISTSDFIQHINTTIDHTIRKAEYFHNSRAIYGHPAGEKSFYAQLGGFAESLHGTDIDEIMLLPDGQYIMQAYQLYEKMFEEDLASLDWRHRPDQMTNELERVNSKIEQQVFAQLKAFYPELTKDRMRNIVNSAIGIGRGMFLTEPEKLAYTDPVDADGNGMIASYSTNDAASLNVFNPLQTALRWQGEHNWNMMYFMPVEGQKGAWDHKKAWDNMAKYMDSFLVGKGLGEGKDRLPEVFADVLIDINGVGGPNKRRGWRMTYSLDGHYVFDPPDADGKRPFNVLKSFRAMEAIGYEALFDFIDKQVPERAMDLLKTTKGPLADQRNEWFKYMYERYFDQKKPLSEYLNKLREKGEDKALKNLTKNGSNDSFEEQVQLETSKLFMDNFIAHYVAERFPTKFLRIDRNRFTEKGKSRWQLIYENFKEKGWDREKFDMVMKDTTMAEMLLRRQISKQIRENITFDKKWTLDRINEIDNLPYRLTKEKIEELLSKNKIGGEFKSKKAIADVVALWEYIRADFNNNEFLDGEGAKKIRDYKFTFGLEDTDISLIAYRGTGPRMIARAIKDTGLVEENITKWVTQMPRILNEIAIDGKHDFSPIIEYLRKGQQAIFNVHGTEGAQEFVYKIAGTVINYFKKDAIAKPLFGLLGIGKRNSIAAEYAGRSTAVWEWDSRDIDRFCVALESYRLLPKNPYDLNKTERAKLVNGKWVEGKFIGGAYENIWVKLPGMKPFKTPFKKRHVDWKWNGAKLRKEYGARGIDIAFDWIFQLLPILGAYLLWKYIQDALNEVTGKKK